jgi:hypothetical protein
MPSIPNPKLSLPMTPPTPQMLLALKQPQMPTTPTVPSLDQPKLMKMLSPYIDLGKGVANGKVTCS